VVGTCIGYVAQAGIAYLLKDLVRGELPPPALAPAVLGLLAPLAVLTGFALPPLLQLRRVPPARVLRRNIEPPPLRYVVVYGTAMLAVAAMLFYMVRDLRLVWFVFLGVVGSVLVLYGAGWLLVKSLSGLRGSVGVAWRYGMANVARRGRESIVQVMAFGLGLMVLLHLTVVRHDLMNDWRNSLPEHAPNQFLINIRPEQVSELGTFFTQSHIAVPVFVPMVRARLAAINDKPVQAHAYSDDRAKNFVEREANLTWSKQLPDGNKITSGSWWREGDGGGARVSVENGIAEALGLKLGDRLTYDVAGIPVTAKVTSTRAVEWDSFKPNFFMVFSPGVLDTVVGTYITSVHIDPEQRSVLTEFYRRFPEITAIDIDAIIKQVRGVMDDASRAVQYVFIFAILAGITVLLAAIQSTRDERRYESAMLRTLGASRKVVLQGVATEFTVLGILSGTLAATGASVAGYFFATHMLDLKYHADPVVWMLGWISGALLVGTAGTLATRSVVNHPPAAILKEAGND
jgi:putative ABC transport system permease protein